MEQSQVLLGKEQQSDELFSQQNQGGNPDLIEKLNRDEQIANNSTKNQTSSENNTYKKNKKGKKKRKFYEVVFKFYGINDEKIKHDYGKSKNYILKEEIASMVEKKQKQLEEQNKQMKQKEGMGRKEEIKEVGGLKKNQQIAKNVIKEELSSTKKNYKNLIIPFKFVGITTNQNSVYQIYQNLFEYYEHNLNTNNNHKRNNNFKA